MLPNRALLFAFAPVLLGIAGLACNGKLAPDDTGALTSKSKTGGAEKEPAEKSDETDGEKDDDRRSPSPSCAYVGQSSSASGDPPLVFQCESKASYTCNGSPRDLTCGCSGSQGKWSPGSCSCNGLTFDFDCTNGCSPGPKEYAKCNLPEPDEGSSGTSGSSSGWATSSASSSG